MSRSAASTSDLAALYRETLLDDVMPFWLRHGLDRDCGGIITALDRDGTVLDTDKSVWFQGRAAWMFATLHQTVDRRGEWLEAARSCVGFMRRHCFAAGGKMYFMVTREGLPLRMRRYVFSEAFAAIALAAYAKAAGDDRAAAEAVTTFGMYLRHSFTAGVMSPKVDSRTRPMKVIAPLMMGIATAQEIRECLGDIEVSGRTCSGWITAFIAEIEADFCKPGLGAVMETVAPDGGLVDHLDGRLLNPGHAIECAWFILREGDVRKDDALVRLGCTMLDWMWRRGWDEEHGGLFYHRDLHGRPVLEYWQDMKFWWPHCEAIIASLMAWKLTGEARYHGWWRQVHEWSFTHFPDREHGEWFGWLRRDGSVSQPAKGSMFKGPFHLPRMLWICWRLLDELEVIPGRGC